ncbi:hypothetical protein Tco_0249416, partial [Tanacetum coccineum]
MVKVEFLEKLLDESQVLLRVLRKDNIYSVDLKSVVPTKGGYLRVDERECIIRKKWSSRPIHLVTDGTVYKEWEDKMERAANAASTL